MRILFANTIQMFGGGEVWMLRTLDGLRRRGHEVALLCRPGTRLARKADEQGVRVFTMNVRGDLGPITLYRAFRLLRREKFDVILTNMDKELRFMGLAAKLAGRGIVIPRRGVDFPLKNRIRYRLSYNWLADVIIANSQATKQALLRNAPWLKPERIIVIYNGIDPEPFSGQAKDTGWPWQGQGEGAPIIGFAGQLDERKGIQALLDAFAFVARHLNAHLVMAGEGPLRALIEDFARQRALGDRIHLLGFVEPISDFMKAIDVFVLPSLWEGFGIVLIEAMAAGKPCITTRVSSMPEIVLDGVTGRVVPVNDVDALAHAMRELAENRDLARRFGEAGRARVLEHFTLERMLDQLESLFERRMQEANER